MLSINDPEIVAEVASAFDAYEAALLANDVATLQGFFWDSPLAARFGVAEQLYGFADIAAFRQSRVLNFSRRDPLRLEICAFGRDVASAMYEYTADIDGRDVHGRQSQTWIRVGGAWRIAAAHVSHAPSAPSFLDAALRKQGLKPEAAWRDRIAANFAATAALAAPLLAFELPETTEPAPVFAP